MFDIGGTNDSEKFNILFARVIRPINKSSSAGGGKGLGLGGGVSVNIVNEGGGMGWLSQLLVSFLLGVTFQCQDMTENIEDGTVLQFGVRVRHGRDITCQQILRKIAKV